MNTIQEILFLEVYKEGDLLGDIRQIDHFLFLNLLQPTRGGLQTQTFRLLSAIHIKQITLKIFLFPWVIFQMIN